MKTKIYSVDTYMKQTVENPTIEIRTNCELTYKDGGFAKVGDLGTATARRGELGDIRSFKTIADACGWAFTYAYAEQAVERLMLDMYEDELYAVYLKTGKATATIGDLAL